MGLLDRYKGWPRWARIAAPVGAAFLALGAISSATEDEEPERIVTAQASAEDTMTGTDEPTATEAPTTTVITTTTSVVTTTTTAPPPPTTTTTTVRPTAPPTTAAQDCHPSYDPCVPRASDVDCAGGGGNGPEYVDGPVQVNGPDEYGLDRDGNGVGCES